MITHTGRRAAAARAAAASQDIPIPTEGFACIKVALARQWQAMSAGDLYRTTAEKDALWDTYLGSFPEGTNPVFRKRTEHDCSCCRSFIRNVGNVVTIRDDKLVSIWDAVIDHPAYSVVAAAMSALVKASPIDNLFLHTEASVGTDRNHEGNDAASVKTWEHFFVRLPNSLVCRGADIGPTLSAWRAAHDVLLRALAGSPATEDAPASVSISMGAVNTTLELIGQNSLYRGEEREHDVRSFQAIKAVFDHTPEDGRDIFVWAQLKLWPESVAKIRNTAIGTLLVDLSEGMDLEQAVRRYEVVVAPENYKRPTALVTRAMTDRARATVAELGLTSALERRFATLADVSINDVLFADRSARTAMAGDVFSEIAGAPTVKPVAFDRVEEVNVQKFLADVLPHATSLEIMVENRHAANFVSLIAPADPAAKPMFKWDNRFSWSYAGDVADSMKARVKKAGGNVTGELCCRLAWFNTDDLDFHMTEPNGYEISFRTARYESPSGGRLDVDMNVGGETREPVENIFYGTTRRMKEGPYRLFVNSYTKRETRDVGFECEIDFKGALRRFTYERAVRHNENVPVADFVYSHARGIEYRSALPSTSISSRVWGIDTEAFHRVNVALLSPNCWGGHHVGNRHFFFMLADCRNDGTARGFYNEFLRSDLDQHRKVLELVGSRMRAEESSDQLSGLGFSSTQRNHVIARVTGAFTRTVKVTF